jgi:hypothetical protein
VGLEIISVDTDAPSVDTEILPLGSLTQGSRVFRAIAAIAIEWAGIGNAGYCYLCNHNILTNDLLAMPPMLGLSVAGGMQRVDRGGRRRNHFACAFLPRR